MAEIRPLYVSRPIFSEDRSTISLKQIFYFLVTASILIMIHAGTQDLWLKGDSIFDDIFGAGYYMFPIVFLALILNKSLFKIIIGEYLCVSKTRFRDLYRVLSFFAIVEIMIICYLSIDGVGIFMTNPFNHKIFALVSIVILTPIWEETFFRGILFKYMNQRLHVSIAVLLSSALFALGHFDSFQHIIAAFIGGVAMCIIYYKSNLVCSILFHTIHNFMTNSLHFHKLEHIEHLQTAVTDLFTKLFA